MDLLCQGCNTEMTIERTGFVIDQAEEDMKLFNVPVFKCRNKACGGYGKEVRGEPIPLAFEQH